MELREIKEQLGRVRLYYLRNDIARALGSAVLGVKGIVQSGVAPSTEIKGHVREAIQLLSRDDQIKSLLTAPLGYQAGQERALLAQLANLYKALLEEQEREDRVVAFARKQKIDQALNLGMRLLTQGQISEADAQFAEAVSVYRDEHTVFRTISKALLDSGEVRRAIPYIKKGMEVLPADPEMTRLFEQAKQMRDTAPDNTQE